MSKRSYSAAFTTGSGQPYVNRPFKRARVVARPPQSAPRTGGYRNPVRMRGSSPAELKWIDVNSTSAFAATTGVAALTLLNGCSLGSDATNRVGRKIQMKSIQMRMSCLATTANAARFAGRVMVVYDSQANAAAPTQADIFQAATSWHSPMNLNNRERFKVIFDKLFTVDSLTGSNTDPWICKKFKKLPNLETIFNSGNAGTIGDIQTGSMYLVTLATGEATTTPGLVFYSRIRFADP